jgi:hypothetical protein
MQNGYAYYPRDKPVVGGHSATFSAFSRSIGKSTAIAATKRVIEREPYEPTGDEAFDLRAQAFRDVLLAGTSKAFEESPKAFHAAGLYFPGYDMLMFRYWQGTYGTKSLVNVLSSGNPKLTERFKNPPTNSLKNYSPGISALAGSQELQEWMFKDFNYAAWMLVKG